jgi:hypothetical protein
VIATAANGFKGADTTGNVFLVAHKDSSVGIINGDGLIEFMLYSAKARCAPAVDAL